MFALGAASGAGLERNVCRWAGVLEEPPSLLALSLGFVARNLARVDSLEGLPDDIVEMLCFIAKQVGQLSAQSVPRLVGGVQTLDLSGCDITDQTLRQLGADLGARSTMQHLSLSGCKDVTPLGVQALLEGCTALQSLNISNCRQLLAAAEHVPPALPRRLAPDGWEEEERWRGCSVLRTLIWTDAPCHVVEVLRREFSWLAVDTAGDQVPEAFEHLAARTLKLVHPCLWGTPAAPESVAPAPVAMSGKEALHPAERMMLAMATAPTSCKTECVADCWPVCRCKRVRHDERAAVAEQRRSEAGTVVYLGRSDTPGADREMQRRLDYARRRQRLRQGGGYQGPVGGAHNGSGGGL